jgi:hypothetical protein
VGSLEQRRADRRVQLRGVDVLVSDLLQHLEQAEILCCSASSLKEGHLYTFAGSPDVVGEPDVMANMVAEQTSARYYPNTT